MSFEAMAWAAKQRPKNSTQRLILLHIASMTNADGIAWPSYNHLADVCGVTRRTAINAVNELCRGGYMSRQHRRIDDKTNRSNQYRLRLHDCAISSLGGAISSLGGSETDSPTSETRSPGGSEIDSPRNSHSFETVKETERGGAKRAQQLPHENLPEDFKHYAEEKRPDLDAGELWENFRDYYLGHGKPMKDWKRTWQRWVRNEKAANKNDSYAQIEATILAGSRS